MNVNAPFMLIAEYFPYNHPRHVLTTSITACAFPLGNLVFNALTYRLLLVMGWRWMFITLGTMYFIICGCGALTFAEPSDYVITNNYQYINGHNDNQDIGTSSDVIDEQEYIKTQMRKGNNKFNSSPDGYKENGAQQDGLCIQKRNAMKPPNTERKENINENSINDASALTSDKISEYKDDSNTIAEKNLIETETITFRSKIVIYGLWFLASWAVCSAYYVPVSLLVEIMGHHGIPQWKASNALVVMGAAEVFSRLLIAYFGDSIKGQMLKMYALFTFLLACICFFSHWAQNYTHWLMYGIGISIFGGPIIASLYSSCGEVYGGKDVPLLFSLFRVGLGLGMLGPMAAGVLFDRYNSFGPVMVV